MADLNAPCPLPSNHKAFDELRERMTDHSRQDRTRSPRPNELANLYRLRDEAAEFLLDCEGKVKMWNHHLRQIDRAIKRACGDAVVPEGDRETHP